MSKIKRTLSLRYVPELIRNLNSHAVELAIEKSWLPGYVIVGLQNVTDYIPEQEISVKDVRDLIENGYTINIK